MLTPDQKEHLKTLLHRHVLFSLLDERASEHLADAVELVTFSLGEVVIRQGDRGDCAYLIHTGKVRVVKTGDNGKPVTLGTLGAGDLFGEYAVLRNEVRSATVRVSEDVSLFRIRQADFLELVRLQPSLGGLLDQLIRKRNLIDFLRRQTVFEAVPLQRLLALADEMREVPFEEGETLLRQGEVATRLLVVRQGEVRMSREGPTPLLAHLGPGSHLGDEGLLLNRAAEASCTATRPTVCLALEAERFQRLVSEVEPLRAGLLHRLGQEEAPAIAAPTAEAQPKQDEEEEFQPRRRGWWQGYPWVPQHDESDCGAAALAMVAKYHGVRLSVGRLRETAHVGREGASLLSLSLAAEHVGFNARAVRADLTSLARLDLPVIAHHKGGLHYVVVYEVKPDRVVVGDPALGIVKTTPAEFEKEWTGRLLLLTPTPRLRGETGQRNAYQRFLPYLTPFRWLLVEVLLASLLLECLRLASPIFTQVIVDKVLVHQNVNMLNIILAGMLFLGTFQIAATFLRQYLLLHVGQKLGLALTGDLFRQVLRLPMRFFHTRKIGDLLVRFQDNQRVKEFLTGRAITTLLDVFTIVTSLGLMLYYSPRLTLVAVAAFPLYVGLTLGFTPWLRQNNRLTFERKTHAESSLVEAIRSVGTIKDATAEQTVRWKYEDLVILQANVEHRGRRVGLFVDSVFRSVQVIANLLLLWYGAHLVIQQELTVGQLMAFSALAAMLTAPILGVSQLWFEVQNLAVSLERLHDLHESPAEQEAGKPAVPLPRLHGHLHFDNVCFRYAPEDRNILCNVTLDVKPGQVVALVGRSGAGKTTLAMLLQRYYLPTEGKITIDGFDLSAVDVRSLRDQLGVVSQETTVLTGTIRDNIALGMPDAPLERVMEAAKQAHAHDFIMGLPLAYDTVVGDLGVRLSGGQRQRIAIARALMRDPRVLILDEATGALDYESEAAIQQNLAGLMKDRTTVVIAHRLSTVQNADCIVVLEAGQIVEQGTHAELQAKRGLYYYLTSKQLAE